MAIDGTPPFKLPPGAQPILLNDFDILTITQFPVSGAGPYTVPSGRRLVITGAAVSFVELTASPPAGGRDFLNFYLTVTSIVDVAVPPLPSDRVARIVYFPGARPVVLNVAFSPEPVTRPPDADQA